MSDRPWLPYVAITCACTIGTCAFWPVPMVREALVLGSAIGIGGTLVHFLKGRRDRYDLTSLREVHEREELRNLDVPDGKDLDTVICLCCNEVYSTRFKTCPNCATRR